MDLFVNFIDPCFYDSLFAKIVVWGDTRNTVVKRMKRALTETHVEGIETNIPFHLKVLEDNSFKKGDIDTTFIKRKGIIDKLIKEGEENRNGVKGRQQLGLAGKTVPWVAPLI